MKFLLIIFTFLIISCKTPPWKTDNAHMIPISRVYYNIQRPVLWEKILESLADFTIERSSMNEGIIVTEWKEENVNEHFILYSDRKMPLLGKYRITIFIEQLEQGIDVKILKEHLVEAFGEAIWKPINSDELLEKSIHYRIRHLISIYKYFENLRSQEIDKSEFDCPDDDGDGFCDDEEEYEESIEYKTQPKPKKSVKKLKKREKQAKKSEARPKKRKKSGFFESKFFTDFSD